MGEVWMPADPAPEERHVYAARFAPRSATAARRSMLDLRAIPGVPYSTPSAPRRRPVKR
jgi:hypothetical protein